VAYSGARVDAGGGALKIVGVCPRCQSAPGLARDPSH